MQKTLRTEIRMMKDWLVETRRTIHMNPELGFEERETSKLISEWLEKFGLIVTKNIAQTGVVGLLPGKKPGKTIALRADMDALPLDELTQAPYVSRIKGKMHACGHDAHVTILLGAARFFSSFADQVQGNIKWIFQPAEEGGGGGRVMVEQGVLENPRVDAVFAAHVYPMLSTGKVGITRGEALASADRFTLKLLGKGGHAASPHHTRDPILAAGHLITQLHSIVSRNVNPLESGVITVGKIRGGTTYNIIPDEVELLGTVRALNDQVREMLKSRIEEVTAAVARSFGMEHHFDYEYGYPVLVNDPDMITLVGEACSKGIGEENVTTLKPSMGAEDFAYYLEKRPGAYFRLGCGNEQKGIVHPYHSSLFDIDEEVLPIGVEMFVRIVDQYLQLNLSGW